MDPDLVDAAPDSPHAPIRATAPRVIHVGHMDVALRFFDAREEDAKKRYGYWDCEIFEIGASERLNPAKMHDVVFHEITHALWFFMNHGRKFTQEHVCEMVGKGFAMVMRRNPELMRWVDFLMSPEAQRLWVPHPGYNAPSRAAVG